MSTSTTRSKLIFHALPQVFRKWTQNTSELIETRPHKLMCVAAADYAPGSRILAGPNTQHAQLAEGSLLSIAGGHAGLLSAELQDMFAAGAQHTLPAGE